MSRNPVGAILFLVIMMLLQIVVLDNVDIDGYFIPYAYVLGVIFLTFSFGRAAVMLMAFAAGAVIDLFQHTGGLQAMACTLVAFLCDPLVKVFFGIPEKDMEDFDPLQAKNSRTAGLTLLFVLILVHHFVLYFFEVMRFSAIFSALWHALLNAVVTFAVSVVVLSLISVRSNRRQRRRF